ncbi:hypothetical protein Trichorick_01380 (plasmid) [Candidatus Trichorickettsia mobilis]|uniref:Uncharacterized protein n=1 Tax=Candidatus Trichorickettsia mobilis TaxID=1346319 RepID=A0ABZ0UWI8_9RICK|nr:hypothetical protein [Candidatus Trichorickettsia mobilis]WPY01467.1 hypothetical protein Trichorick_01380 [Candidatus Trichorickettsia mobilis]
MIPYLVSLAKPLGAFFVGIIGFLLVKKNQELKQENKEINKIIDIQQKVIDAKEENKNTTADDVIKLMQQDKF